MTIKASLASLSMQRKVLGETQAADAIKARNYLVILALAVSPKHGTKVPLIVGVFLPTAPKMATFVVIKFKSSIHKWPKTRRAWINTIKQHRPLNWTVKRFVIGETKKCQGKGAKTWRPIIHKSILKEVALWIPAALVNTTQRNGAEWLLLLRFFHSVLNFLHRFLLHLWIVIAIASTKTTTSAKNLQKNTHASARLKTGCNHKRRKVKRLNGGNVMHRRSAAENKNGQALCTACLFRCASNRTLWVVHHEQTLNKKKQRRKIINDAERDYKNSTNITRYA